MRDRAMETFVKVDATELWTTSSGAGGVPVLLSNGGPGCCDYLEPVAEMIRPHAQVVRWEQRGCGRSTADGSYDLATTIADMEVIRRHHGFERWIVGGHSWGADLALAYAWHYPERTLGLLAISGGLLVKDRSWNEAYHAGKDGRGEALPPLAYESNLEVNRVLNASWREFTHRADLWQRALAITGPALWIYAEKDIRPSWPEQQIAALLPKGEFKLVAGAEHVIWLTRAEILRAELQGWMQREFPK